MKFWKLCSGLLILALVAFVGFDVFFGEDNGEAMDALKLELEQKNTLVAGYEARIEALEEQLAQTQEEQESAILVYAEQTERLEELLLSGAKAHKVGDSMYTYVVENGGVTLTGYVGSEEKVSVPDTVDGKRVVRIGKETFRETAVREVILPATVTHIDWFAFYGCFGLRFVSIPASVQRIEYGAFEGCSPSLTVRCAKGSYAEKYAKSYGLSLETE